MRIKSILIHRLPWSLVLILGTIVIHGRWSEMNDAATRSRTKSEEERLAGLMRKASEEFESVMWDFRMKRDFAPFQDDLQRELARRLDLDLAELRLKIQQGEQSRDPLIRAHALFISQSGNKAVETAREARMLNMEHSVEVSESYLAEARALTITADWKKVISAYQAALVLLDEERNPEQWMVAAKRLYETLMLTDRTAESELMLRDLFRVQSRQLGESDPATLRSLASLSYLRLSEDMNLEAENAFERFLEITRFGLEKDDWKADAAANHETKTAYENGDFETAEQSFREALKQDTDALGADHISVAIDMHNLAGTLDAQNKQEEAENLYHRSQKIFAAFRKSTGNAHRHEEFSRAAYRRFLKKRGKSEDEVKSVMSSIHGNDAEDAK